MSLRHAILAVSVAALHGAGHEPSFDYSPGGPPAVADSDVALRNLTYACPSGARPEATLVAPTKPGRYPGVLFVHWYDDSAQSSNRTQFLPDALRLARSGVVSLLVDTMWSDPRWFLARNPSEDVPRSVAQVKDLRRALDVLASLPEVDGSRLSLVGHDFGAMYGSVVAGVDRRVKALVFVAGTTRFADWFLLGRKLDPAGEQEVREELSPLDPVRYVGRVAPSPLLFQFATKDPYVTKEAANALFDAAREPKSVKFYECGHEMNQEAVEDRVSWLLHSLSTNPEKP
jgi:fermentation-respiration switch protein FrsA (DUF1100 family)